MNFINESYVKVNPLNILKICCAHVYNFKFEVLVIFLKLQMHDIYTSRIIIVVHHLQTKCVCVPSSVQLCTLLGSMIGLSMISSVYRPHWCTEQSLYSR